MIFLFIFCIINILWRFYRVNYKKKKYYLIYFSYCNLVKVFIKCIYVSVFLLFFLDFEEIFLVQFGLVEIFGYDVYEKWQ